MICIDLTPIKIKGKIYYKLWSLNNEFSELQEFLNLINSNAHNIRKRPEISYYFLNKNQKNKALELGVKKIKIEAFFNKNEYKEIKRKDNMTFQSNLDRFKFYCQDYESPDIYIEFSFYSLISACLQRRVWIGDKDKEIFPNQYIIFVGPPGSGKTIIAKIIIRLLQKLRKIDSSGKSEIEIIPLAPDAISVEALITRLGDKAEKAQRNFSPEPGVLKVQTPLTFISEELGSLFKDNSQDLINFLNQGWDCGDYKKELKYGGSDYIVKICLNMLAATNPGWVARASQFGIIEQGLSARAIFVAGGDKRFKKAFYNTTQEQQDSLDYISKYLWELVKVSGRCRFSNEALTYFENWYEKTDYVINNDKKLQHYYARKKIHVWKLAMVMHFSDNLENKTIELNSMLKAIKALERAEVNMHEALASTSQNPIHVMAINIMTVIKIRPSKSLTLKQIKLLFHEDEIRLGDINLAVEWLNGTGQLRVKNEGLEVIYYL